MEIYEIELFDQDGNFIRRVITQAFKKSQAHAEARNAMATTPNAASYRLV
jgi:hypothetical protein